MSKYITGRPTKYDKKFHCEDIIKRMRNGECVSEVCAEWGIHKDTMYEWVKVHKEFSDSFKIAKECLEAWYVKFFKAQGAGKIKGGNAASVIWLSKNVLNWSEKWSVREDNDVQFEIEE